jgi:hypothetical protein
MKNYLIMKLHQFMKVLKVKKMKKKLFQQKGNPKMYEKKN